MSPLGASGANSGGGTSHRRNSSSNLLQPNSQLQQQSSSSLPTFAHHHPSHSHHHNNNQADVNSRSPQARIRRFLRHHLSFVPTAYSNGFGNGSTFTSNGFFPQSTTRRVRFGIALPALVILAWVVYATFAALGRVIFHHGSRSNGTPSSVYKIPRGNLTDLEMRPTAGTNQTTAILLNWTRLDNLKKIVNNLCPHTMFKEIMIWNNNVDIHLEEKVFSCSKVRVFNAPGNMYFVARYMACAMASSPYCYFQDDDWMIYHLRAMYANFLRFPQFVHTDTNSDVWALTNWHWCFFAAEIDMHSCFSWLGTGALTTRENVVKFLKQASVTEMDPLEFAYGDMYFTTFMNQVPYQLENYLDEMPQDGAFSKGSSGKQRNKLYMHYAAQKTWDALSRNDPMFEKQELSPNYRERDVRSPCMDDRCLVISNKHPFEDVRQFKYRPYIDIEENEIIHRQYEVPDIYVRHPFSHAADGKDDTSYKSTRNIDKGDYLGLDMLLVVENRKVEFRLLFEMGDSWLQHAKIEIGTDGTQYTAVSPKLSCKYVRNEFYSGKLSKEDQLQQLNKPADNRALVYPDEKELREELESSSKWFFMRRAPKPVWNAYEDHGWRSLCTFEIHEPFRFIRVVSGRDEGFPFVVYDFGWKIL